MYWVKRGPYDIVFSVEDHLRICYYVVHVRLVMEATAAPSSEIAG